MRMLVSLLLFVPLWAQQPAPPAKPMPEPKNLQVLKIPASEIMSTMRGFNVGLGVKCDFCHVPREWDKDDKPHKAIARKMITMTEEINGKFPDGKAHVTCYTCHRGEHEPKTAPPAEAPAAAPAK
jgi:Photosynthetic reaction centre cytochrome C subunit